MQKATITGNLAAQAEIKKAKSGNEYLSFRVGVRDPMKKDATCWWNVMIYGGSERLATLERMLGKGAKVTCTGDFSTEAYIGQRDGEAHASLTMTRADVEIQSKVEAQPAAASADPNVPGDDEPLPFDV